MKAKESMLHAECFIIILHFSLSENRFVDGYVCAVCRLLIAIYLNSCHFIWVFLFFRFLSAHLVSLGAINVEEGREKNVKQLNIR